ncbi:MAG: hypothetical protein HY268_16240 [Deltaproteobacteria bacterium]|nr:hypothetical protein [Deltaproteobacteria bacterium]
MKKKLSENLTDLQKKMVLVMGLLCLTMPLGLHAQDADVGFPLQPAPEVRLTGVLEAVKTPQVSAFPLLSVLIDGQPWLLHVSQVEPVIPAYPAQEELQRVSGLGLRLLADDPVLSALQTPEMHNRPIVLEGWLRVEEGVLQVSAVRAAEPAKANP